MLFEEKVSQYILIFCVYLNEVKVEKGVSCLVKRDIFYSDREVVQLGSSKSLTLMM